MTDVLLISEAKVRQFTDINQSLDTDLIKNNIRTSQDYYLQSIIGTNLYNKLMQDVVNNTLTGYYLTLMDSYIQDYLLYAAYYETLESIYLRPRNNGLLKPNGGENSDPIDKDLFNMKRQSVENKMTYYAERLTNYIIEEETQFPELSNSDKLYEQFPDYAEKYKSPFVMKNTVYTEYMRKAGIRTYDNRYKYLPQ
tara:strand:+ start:5400 stop:5987 length:588 start_codon:yes stop_codon:yes gene_type:complete